MSIQPLDNLYYITNKLDCQEDKQNSFMFKSTFEFVYK